MQTICFTHEYKTQVVINVVYVIELYLDELTYRYTLDIFLNILMLHLTCFSSHT